MQELEESVSPGSGGTDRMYAAHGYHVAGRQTVMKMTQRKKRRMRTMQMMMGTFWMK